MMKKFTQKFLLLVVFVTMSAYAMAQVTMTPWNAGAFEEITLTLNVGKSCPADALLKADSVMMHSGITLDGAAWSNVVDFDGVGANGERPKFAYIGPYVPAAITITPGDATIYDTITLTLDTRLSCPADALYGADSVMMHSGVNLDGAAWSNVVDFDGVGANGQAPKLIHNGDSTWSITFVPASFYGLAEGAVVTQINCVFNNGTWDAEGKDFNADESCTDFAVPFGYEDIYLWAWTFIPSEFYGIEAGADVSALNFVFNGGAWDKGEAKAFNEDGSCTDFAMLLNGVGIEEGIEEHFVIYPNPVHANITLDNLGKAEKVEIFNLTGQLVKTIALSNTDKISVDVSELEAGVYFINVMNENGVQSSKFIKQ